ncbi:helix-turn-helix transcriptional regulator [Vibrio parahaemolyticus]|nr:helix-turn-helix transcriptional regulator [Vibrio parahaemolyticus]
MERLVKVCWIGRSHSSIPENVRFLIAQYFEVLDHSSDIGVLSDKRFDYFFYYALDDNSSQLQTIIKICENLHKKLIVLYSEGCEELLPPDHITAERYALNDESLAYQFQLIKKMYFVNNNLDSFKISFNTIEHVNCKSKITKVFDFVSNNLDKEIRVEKVAELCCYSPTSFSRFFHQEVGISFRDYVTSQRIALAKKALIEDKSVKISYVAYQCGYRDVSYFSRIFKKKTGVSPGDYRKELNSK